MKSVALGVRMHSGWGVLVTVGDEAEIVDRRRFVVVSDEAPGGKMPFHHAEKVGLPQAEAYLTSYIAECDRHTRQAIERCVDDLRARGSGVNSAAIVLSSGLTLPDLPKILASHPLIHSAEGELFRESARRACQFLGIRTIGYRERDLPARAKQIFGDAAAKIIDQLARGGKALGPPWTGDYKCAALAAYLAHCECHPKRKRIGIAQ
jgi:hypothetical protein